MRGEQGEQLDAGEILGWLEEHRLNGNREEGFWRHHEAAPSVSEEETNALTDLAMDLDVEGLRELLETEQAGWAREGFLESISKALERAQGKLEELAAATAATAAPAPAHDPKGTKA